jgi:polyisoprenoid-binding protein YceI
LASPGTYSLVPQRCAVDVSVRHLVAATMRIRFRAAGGKLVVRAGDPLASWVRVDVDAASAATGSIALDRAIHEDLLDAGNSPFVRFESTIVERARGDELRVHGDLYLRGEARPLVLTARLVALGEGRVGIAASGRLNRPELGLGWGSTLEAGGVVVSSTARIDLAVEFAR